MMNSIPYLKLLGDFIVSFSDVISVGLNPDLFIKKEKKNTFYTT